MTPSAAQQEEPRPWSWGQLSPTWPLFPSLGAKPQHTPFTRLGGHMPGAPLYTPVYTPGPPTHTPVDTSGPKTPDTHLCTHWDPYTHNGKHTRIPQQTPGRGPRLPPLTHTDTHTHKESDMIGQLSYNRLSTKLFKLKFFLLAVIFFL